MFPTYVGMNRKLDEGIELKGYVPHVRGDEPMTTEAVTGAVECSPRTWG